MRTGLTKQEKTTDIWFDEKEPLIHTHQCPDIPFSLSHALHRSAYLFLLYSKKCIK